MTTVKFQRNTRQRQVILDELKKYKTHPTALELFKVVRQQLPKISLGTVYRNLELLVRMNLARKINSNSSETRFDGIPEPHYHIRCSECDRIDDLTHMPFEIATHDESMLDGYEVTGFNIEFSGICPGCRQNRT